MDHSPSALLSQIQDSLGDLPERLAQVLSTGGANGLPSFPEQAGALTGLPELGLASPEQAEALSYDPPSAPDILMGQAGQGFPALQQAQADAPAMPELPTLPETALSADAPFGAVLGELEAMEFPRLPEGAGSLPGSDGLASSLPEGEQSQNSPIGENAFPTASPYGDLAIQWPHLSDVSKLLAPDISALADLPFMVNPDQPWFPALPDSLATHEEPLMALPTTFTGLGGEMTSEQQLWGQQGGGGGEAGKMIDLLGRIADAVGGLQHAPLGQEGPPSSLPTTGQGASKPGGVGRYSPGRGLEWEWSG